jgi:hypothetical protein
MEQAEAFHGVIVLSLADSICRHPDSTLESGLVPHTIGDLSLRFLLTIQTQSVAFKIIAS